MSIMNFPFVLYILTSKQVLHNQFLVQVSILCFFPFSQHFDAKRGKLCENVQKGLMTFCRGLIYLVNL